MTDSKLPPPSYEKRTGDAKAAFNKSTDRENRAAMVKEYQQSSSALSNAIGMQKKASDAAAVAKNQAERNPNDKRLQATSEQASKNQSAQTEVVKKAQSRVDSNSRKR